MTDYFFEIADSTDLKHLRDMQASELRGTVQDWIEEGIITYNAEFIKIFNNTEIIGYACIGTYDHFKDIILEYYLISKYRTYSADIIKHLIKSYKCKQWLVNTHDFFAFPLMLDLQFKYVIDGYTFAFDDSTGIECELGSDITIEVTTSGEIKEAYQLIMQDGFYSGGDINTVVPLIAANEMYSLRRSNELVGVGFVGASKRTPIYADIAMIINREKQTKWLWCPFL